MNVLVSSFLFTTALWYVVHCETVRDRARGRDRVNSTSTHKMRRTKSESIRRQLIEEMLSDYEMDDPPQTDTPTKVRLGIYINDLISVSEQDFAFSLNMYLRQAWHDPRLTFPPVGGIREMLLGTKDMSRIWIPDTFFRNEKQAQFHDVTVPNHLLRLKHTGDLWLVVKLTLTLSCPVNLHNYPMDTQICPMMFESFAYKMDVINFEWMEEPVDGDSDVSLPQFVLEDLLRSDCSKNYTSGAFPCLKLQLVLRRNLGYSLLQVFFPSITVVVLSWLAFIVDIDNVAERMSIGLLMILSILTISNGSQASLPKVSYVKAIDAWMFVCTVFVFASLIEFGVVNILYHKGKIRFKHRRHGGSGKHKNGYAPSSTKYSSGRVLSERIDRACIICFPLAFAIFNVIYWIGYTRPIQYSDYV